ncbi:polysaccharide biosynthesis tyrosine autokinase [uncultured Acetobacteroides sp.]|uniref:GumC family protein n=1 Tax=uncultured Acetobacteroides sp. TaxID=1760811 RepID=UPI0029F4E64F|nr:polysaccharide biosynthesis tyrosine autokinase [uncultured Acetobacteroides sp.]
MNPREVEQYPTEQSLDVKKYVNMVIRNWYWFATSLAICLAVAYAITFTTKPVYQVNSTILIRDDKNRTTTGAEALLTELSLVNNTKSIQNEIGILKSYSLASSTINELSDFHTSIALQGRGGVRSHILYKDAPFLIQFTKRKRNPIERPLEIEFVSNDKYTVSDNGSEATPPKKFFEEVSVGSFSFRLIPTSTSPTSFIGRTITVTRNDLNKLANFYRNNIKVDLVDKNASLIALSSTGNSAEQEADYLNKMVEVYIRQQLNEKNQIAKNTIDFIDGQLFGMKDSLNKAESNLKSFRTTNKILDISKESDILLDMLKEQQSTKAEIDINQRYYAYLKNYLTKRENFSDIVAPYTLGINDLQLNTILNELSAISAERDNLKLSVKENNPAMLQVNRKLNRAKESLMEKVNSLIVTNKMTKEDIDKQMNQLESRISTLPSSEQLLINKTKLYDLLSKTYTYLLEKKSEASIAKASNISDCKVVDPAMPINSVLKQPKPLMNYTLGFILGLLIPFIVIILRDYFDDKIRTIKEVTDSLSDISMLATLNHSAVTTELPVVERPKSHISESFRELRTNLNYVIAEGKSKIIMVTSLISGEGKTFCACNLSAIYAASGKRTLLVGLDIRKPKVQAIFEITSHKGMSTYLSNHAYFEETISPTTIPNLWIAVSGPIPPNPSELIGSPRMKEFLEEAQKHYDCIIIDTPPIGIVSDARIIFNLVDLVLFVTRMGVSPKDVVEYCKDLHLSLKNKLAMTINDFDSKLGYGYYSKYRNYYRKEYNKHDYYEN